MLPDPAQCATSAVRCNLASRGAARAAQCMKVCAGRMSTRWAARCAQSASLSSARLKLRHSPPSPLFTLLHARVAAPSPLARRAAQSLLRPRSSTHAGHHCDPALHLAAPRQPRESTPKRFSNSLNRVRSAFLTLTPTCHAPHNTPTPSRLSLRAPPAPETAQTFGVGFGVLLLRLAAAAPVLASCAQRCHLFRTPQRPRCRHRASSPHRLSPPFHPRGFRAGASPQQARLKTSPPTARRGAHAPRLPAAPSPPRFTPPALLQPPAAPRFQPADAKNRRRTPARLVTHLSPFPQRRPTC